MAYKVALTNIPGDSFRPWNARLGIYTPGEFVVPTWSDGRFQREKYPFMQPAAPVVVAKKAAGMGAFDLSSITSSPLAWIAAAGAAYWLLKKKGMI